MTRPTHTLLDDPPDHLREPWEFWQEQQERALRAGVGEAVWRRLNMEDIGHVSYWARMYSLKAQVDACLVRAMGMQAENMARQSRGEAMAYNDDSFMIEARAIDSMAEMLCRI
jgi:hypothetical protein